MTRARGFVLFAAFATALLLAGCENFDPTAIFDSDLFDTKKKLAGERKPVFPEGTPGVPQGVPPELVRGNQQSGQPETTQSVPQHAAAQGAEAEPKPEPKPEPQAKAKPKPKPKTVAKPKPAEPATASAEQPAQSAWPEPPAARQTQSAGALPSGPQQPSGAGGVQWPEPPPYSERSRPQ